MREATVSREADDDRDLVAYLSPDRLVSARSTAPPHPAASGNGLATPAVWLLGTGTPALVPDRAGPATLLQVGSDLLLVDCGNRTAYQVMALDLEPRDITHIFITHHHIDHNSDLAYLLISTWVQRRDDYKAPLIVGPPGTRRFVDLLLGLHEYDLRVRALHGYDAQRLAASVVEVEDGTTLGGDGWSAVAFKVDHAPVRSAFGYRFDLPSGSVGISGDTRPCENLVTNCQGVDLLIHEAIYPGFGIPEYHTLSTEVGGVATAVGTKHLALTHLLPGHLPDEKWVEHVQAGFDGRITVGRDLMRVW